MKIPKKEVDPAKWQEVVTALKAGTMDRKQAAEHVGLLYQTFIAHLRRSGVTDELRGVAKHASSGANSRAAKEDPDRHERYANARAMALKTGSVRSAADTYKVNYQVLARQVRAEKAKLVEPAVA